MGRQQTEGHRRRLLAQHCHCKGTGPHSLAGRSDGCGLDGAARQTRRDGGRPVEGNGALMRTVYPGLYCKTKGAAEMQARAFAEMTHRGDKSTEACVLYTRMVYLLTESVGNFQDGGVADFCTSA